MKHLSNKYTLIPLKTIDKDCLYKKLIKVTNKCILLISISLKKSIFRYNSEKILPREEEGNVYV